MNTTASTLIKSNTVMAVLFTDAEKGEAGQVFVKAVRFDDEAALADIKSRAADMAKGGFGQVRLTKMPYSAIKAQVKTQQKQASPAQARWEYVKAAHLTSYPER